MRRQASTIAFSSHSLNHQHKLRSIPQHLKEFSSTSTQNNTAKYLLLDVKSGNIRSIEQDGGFRLKWLDQVDSEIMDRAIFLGTDDLGIARFAASIDVEESQSKEFVSLRNMLGQLSEEESGIAAQAKMIVEWNRETRFCSSCGNELQMINGGFAKYCKSEDKTVFPKIEPCVIMLVIDPLNDRVLLAQGVRHKYNVISCLAGFMEIGETAEHAIRREVMEEAGVKVGRVEYVVSQPWPFPRSLMLGFYAEALTTELDIDEEEIVNARWISRDALERVVYEGSTEFNVPPRGTIARYIMEDWLNREKKVF